MKELTVEEISKKLGFEVKVIAEEPPPEIQELTVEEISKKLGYEIKVVSEPEPPKIKYVVTDENDNPYSGDIYLLLSDNYEVNDDVSVTIKDDLFIKVNIVGEAMLFTIGEVKESISSVINVDAVLASIAVHVSKNPEYYNFYNTPDACDLELYIEASFE